MICLPTGQNNVPDRDEDGRQAGVIVARTEAFFRPDGVLASAVLPRSPSCEYRPQQAAMATAVARALESNTHLAVEAGTGVGKSFAYLVPSLWAAVSRGTHVLVSTHTISLQEQLMGKDVPFLRRCLGIDFKAVLAKGRSNYLCLRRLQRTRREAPELLEPGRNEALSDLAHWAGQTAEGSLQDMSRQPPRDLWVQVCAEQGNCLGPKCMHRDRCFLLRARRELRDAHLLVVNHHLFFSELALRLEGAAFLPKYVAAVLDEAHQVPGVATEHFGLRLSPSAVDQALNRLCHPGGAKGLMAVLRDSQAAADVERLREEMTNYFTAVETWAAFQGDDRQRTVAKPLDIPTAAPDLFDRLTARLRRLREGVNADDLGVELEAAMQRTAALRDLLVAFCGQTLDDHVYWVEKEGRRRQTVLHAAPLDIAPILEKALFGTVPSVVLTSATLAVEERLDFFCEQVGASRCERLVVGSPFDYATQMRILLPRRMPDPNDAERFAQAAARAVCCITIPERGRAFVLFTSARMMRAVAERAAPTLSAEGLELFQQGDGMPRHVMLERFRDADAGVLFGLDSFWMGVDVPGPALSTVIITRLPFAVPTHPLLRARMDRLRRSGGNPFLARALPDAVLKFRQGVGRLIRSTMDRGRIVVLDRRIADRWYGRVFFASLQECPVEEVDFDTQKSFFTGLT